jgi:hypothetical protein
VTWRGRAGPRRAAGLVLVALLSFGAAGLLGAPTAGAARKAHDTCTRPAPQTLPPPSPIGPYSAAITAAGARGLNVWVETDLVRRWWAGQASFDAGVQRLAELGRNPAVTGFKIADELGYGDVLEQHPECTRAFVLDAVTALHGVAPHAQVLVDLVVPALGCAPGIASVRAQSQQCTAAADAKYPALTLSAVDRLLSMGALDMVDLSTGLLDDATYASWGITPVQAQQAAWGEVAKRHWADHVALAARKALAHPGNYPGDAAAAKDATTVFVTTPLDEGARAVDVWTWRQAYEGDTYRLANPGLESNPLWDQLVTLHDQGADLMTHFSPKSVEVGLDADLDMLSHAFRGVFVAAGAG